MITIEDLKKLNRLLGGLATIAGGCFRSFIEGNEPNDIDIFLSCRTCGDDVRRVVALFTGLEEVETTYSWEYGKYTIIKPLVNNGRRLYGSPKTILSEFDIDVTRLYMNELNDIDTIEPYSVNQICKMIQDRECCVTMFEGHEKRTINRINKYISYGYNVHRVESKPLSSSAFYISDYDITFDTEVSGMSYNDD